MGFCSKISYAFQQCKNFENRLRFDKVTDSSKVGTFFCDTVYNVICLWLIHFVGSCTPNSLSAVCYTVNTSDFSM